MNFAGVVAVLPLVGKGMLGVFIVIGIVWLSVAAMMKIFK